MAYDAINLEVEQIFNVRNSIYNMYVRHVGFSYDKYSLQNRILNLLCFKSEKFL